MANINRVVIAGNLTRDPELRQLSSGNSVCKLRVAVNTRVKDRDSGQWGDKPNFFDVTVWGAQGESCARYLQKGSGILIDGRLEWREWDAQDGTKRQSVEIIAENTQFTGARGEGGGGGGGGFERDPADEFAPVAASSGPRPVPAADDDDIPF
jgi:single-strand DNA-binding protein